MDVAEGKEGGKGRRAELNEIRLGDFSNAPPATGDFLQHSKRVIEGTEKLLSQSLVSFERKTCEQRIRMKQS